MGRSEFEVMDSSTDQLAAKRQGGGCHVTVVTGFILVLLAIVISVIIALIVFFSVKTDPAPLNCTISNPDQVCYKPFSSIKDNNEHYNIYLLLFLIQYLYHACIINSTCIICMYCSSY